MDTKRIVKGKQVTTGARHSWVCQRKLRFTVQVNTCTETGDMEIHTDMPIELSDAQLKQLAGVE